MELYNTLTRKVEIFEPQANQEVTLYTCGPTVYDFAHVGHWAAYIRWDTLVRVMQEHGYTVDWVMNLTDVGHLTSDADEGEDKLEKGAKREGKSAWDIAAYYIEDFKAGMRAVNMLRPAHLERATDHIAEQIALVKKLEDKGYTYKIDDGIYFDTSKVADYGKLAHVKPDVLNARARVESNPQKRNPVDFALWKFSPTGRQRDMEWDSPWGKGFPGWHIECSAMAMHYLGDTLDIHTGGIDHIPVHHTNEIAQSEAATGQPFARFWLHSNFLNIDGTKISKSLNNGISLRDIQERGFDPLDLRTLVLQSHYRSAANFTWEALAAARQRRLNLQAFADLRFQLKDGGGIDEQALVTVKRAVRTELLMDMHTPEALAALSDLVTSAESNLISSDAAAALGGFLKFLDRLFGLELLKSQDITSSQKDLISQREQARAKKNFDSADDLRTELLKQGVSLRDTPLGTIWNR